MGYIIQDDCSEVLLDFNHEINITATDMLGTLKDISIKDAAYLYPDYRYYENIEMNTSSGLYNILTLVNLPDDFLLGSNNTITITNGTPFDGTYTISSYNLYVSGGGIKYTELYLNETITVSTSEIGRAHV